MQTEKNSRNNGALRIQKHIEQKAEEKVSAPLGFSHTASPLSDTVSQFYF